MLEKILPKTKSLQKTARPIVIITAILLVLVITYGVYALFNKEPDAEILDQGKEELKDTDIQFRQEVIDKIKDRKESGLPLDFSGLGRDNPFLGY